MVLGSSPVAVTYSSGFAPAWSKEFLDIQATIECGFTLKRVRGMTRTYSLVCVLWKELMIKYTVFEKLVKEFRILGCKNNELFKYRDKLIHDLAPVLSDLVRPFREGN